MGKFLDKEITKRSEENAIKCYYYLTYGEKTIPEIAKTLNLSISTVRNYINKFINGYSTVQTQLTENDFLSFIDPFYNHLQKTKQLESDKNAYAYIMILKKNKRTTTLKVGKTCNLNRRLSQLKQQYGKQIEIFENFQFMDEEQAYIFETILHRYYKIVYKDSEFIPQDRFEIENNVLDLEQDIDELQKIYNNFLQWNFNLNQQLIKNRK